MSDIAQNLRDSNAVSIEFLKTELSTGLLFADLALGAGDPEKKSRNTKNARTAYEAILKFIVRVTLDDDDTRHMTEGMTLLKSHLRELGETF